MCGIIGVFNDKEANKKVALGLKILKPRGRDGSKIIGRGTCAVGHNLHAIVNKVEQPFSGKGVLGANCEIYNWKKICMQKNLKVRNDAELLFKLCEEKRELSKEILNSLDGVYAIFYWINDALYLARDIIGEKPIWYSHTDSFAFASEKKALEKLGYVNCQELNPRTLLVYDINKNQITENEIPFFQLDKTRESEKQVIEKTKKLIIESVNKRIPEKKLGILFSGGVDSCVLAALCKKLGKKVTLYTAAVEESNMRTAPDLLYARKAAKALGLPLKERLVKVKEVPVLLKKVVPLIESSNVVKVGVALPFFVAAREAKKDKCKVLFSGLGSEELFAGYERHKQSLDINKECLYGILRMYERDLYRDDVVTMYHTIELRLPFLDLDLVKYSLTIPPKMKLTKNENKIVLRKIAEEIGVPKEFAYRKKEAAQYGSNFDKAIEKLTKRAGLKKKSEYLLQYYPQKNLKLAALISGGKDSIYAMHVMNSQNYQIQCLVTIASKNPDSYMFHTPTIEMTKLQAESQGIPLIIKETLGEKEKELDDLKEALLEAKKKYEIEGVIVGALYSTYQRDRVHKICDKLGLKMFAPLWHLRQDELLSEILKNKFEVIITSVAAEGLDEKWLARKLDEKAINDLIHLKNHFGINEAGEGGEYETLVLDAPLFKKRIVIGGIKKIMDTKNSGRIIISTASLKEKKNPF